VDALSKAAADHLSMIYLLIALAVALSFIARRA